MPGLLAQLGRGFRWFLAAIAAVLVLWSFARVISRPFTHTVDRGKTQITILHWGDKNEDKIVADLVRDFESLPENQDIRVQRINLGQAAAVNTKLQTMFAAGDAPDAFYLGFEKVLDFASKDLLADMDELIAKDPPALLTTQLN